MKRSLCFNVKLRYTVFAVFFTACPVSQNPPFYPNKSNTRYTSDPPSKSNIILALCIEANRMVDLPADQIEILFINTIESISIYLARCRNI